MMWVCEFCSMSEDQLQLSNGPRLSYLELMEDHARFRHRIELSELRRAEPMHQQWVLPDGRVWLREVAKDHVPRRPTRWVCEFCGVDDLQLRTPGVSPRPSYLELMDEHARVVHQLPDYILQQVECQGETWVLPHGRVWLRQDVPSKD
jgi:hypothetical protein